MSAPTDPTPKQKPTVRGGFIVHRRGDSTSKLFGQNRPFEHPSLDSALAEAHRLSVRFKREFAVFQEVAAVSAPAAPAVAQSEAA